MKPSIAILIISLQTIFVLSAQTLDVKEPANKYQQNRSISELWHYMVFEQDACLGGGQYIKAVQRERPTMFFSRKLWKEFYKQDKAKLTKFLIGKFSDTTKTNIHTCPFYNATNGEMAVYALQHIYKKNWFDFKEFAKYKNREVKSADEQAQIWLQRILSNREKRNKLAELYSNL